MSGLSPEAISCVVGSIYQAAYDPAQWQTAVDRMHAMFNSSRVCIARTDIPPWKAVTSVDDDNFNSYDSYAAHSRDPYMLASISQDIGAVFRRREIIDEVEFQRRELWNEWMRPRDMWDGMTSNLHREGGANWSIHIHRGKGQGELGDSDVRAFRICVDHLIRAKTLGDEVHRATRFGDVFASLPVGIMLADAAGKVEFFNGEAERLLFGPAAIGIKSGKVFCDNPTAQAKISSLISAAASPMLAGTGGGSVIVQAEPQSGLSSIVVSIAPFMGSKLYGLSSQPSAIIVLRDMFLQPSTDVDLLIRELFGLTAAEAKLCVVLASGVTLHDAAMRNAITVKTARTYLERVFSKTATRQQSQLVNLIRSVQPLF